MTYVPNVTIHTILTLLCILQLRYCTYYTIHTILYILYLRYCTYYTYLTVLYIFTSLCLLYLLHLTLPYRCYISIYLSMCTSVYICVYIMICLYLSIYLSFPQSYRIWNLINILINRANSIPKFYFILTKESNSTIDAVGMEWWSNLYSYLLIISLEDPFQQI